jgi:release factor glutamine methyltransferase
MSCLSAPKPSGFQAALRMTAKNSAGAWLAEARARLLRVCAQPALEAQVVLAHVLEKPRAWVLAHPEAALSIEQASGACFLLERRLSGEPLPYLLGHWEFFGLDFKVTHDVLIPRPETELLVEKALAWLKTHPSRRLAVDVGTGSGCIAVSLAHALDDLHVAAVDISRPALLVAQQNIHDQQVEDQVFVMQTSLLYGLCWKKTDLVCANLPYIPSATLAGLEVGRYEPLQALDGGPDGTSYINALLQDAPRWLAPGGLVLLEIEARQGASVSQSARRSFPDAEIQLFHDLSGNPRLVQIENKTR